MRDLLTHRGGLGNVDQIWVGTDYSAAEVIRRAATVEPAYSLRSRFVYQNIMYAVAGEGVAAASGMPWAESHCGWSDSDNSRAPVPEQARSARKTMRTDMPGRQQRIALWMVD